MGCGLIRSAKSEELGVKTAAIQKIGSPDTDYQPARHSYKIVIIKADDAISNSSKCDYSGVMV